MAYTGNDMIRHCETIVQLRPEQGVISPGDAFMHGVCFGTLSGIRFLVNEMTNNISYSICVPVKAPNSQQLSAVVRYIRNHPEKLHNRFESLVLDALVDAWPCKRQ